MEPTSQQVNALIAAQIKRERLDVEYVAHVGYCGPNYLRATEIAAAHGRKPPAPKPAGFWTEFA